MADFRYTALDRSGKQVTGTLVGRDSNEAANRVRAMGYYPMEVAPANGNGGAAGRQLIPTTTGKPRPNIDSRAKAESVPAAGGKRVNRVQVLLFTREMADLIDAGLPLDRALSVLIEQSDDAPLQAMLRKVQGEIRAGNPLSDALRAYPREFPPLYANMIHAGEVSGQLSAVMTRLADFLEKEQVRRSQVMAALTYPAVLMTIAVSAVVFLLTFVVPKLQGVFHDLGNDLPAPTRLLLGMSGFVTHDWWALLLLIGASVFGFRAWVNTDAGRRSFDRIRMQVPLFGPLTHKIVMARFVRTLGTLLAGGVPILDSLEIAASAVGNSVATDSILSTRDGVRQGQTLSDTMAEVGGFLPLVVHMSGVGEETGRLPKMLIRTADTLDFEVDNMMRKLTSLVEPLVVFLMGIFVGFVVLSILLPIFAANNAVK